MPILEREITAVLESGDFDVIRSEDVQAMYERVDAEWGKIFDPVTGRRVPESSTRFEREVVNGYRDELGCDARLVASVVMLNAPFAAGVARWDGARRGISSIRRQIAHFFGGISETGWLSALSLWISIVDLEGNPLVFRSAGIEALVNISFSRGQDKVPVDRWLRNDVQRTEAVLSALGRRGKALRAARAVDATRSPLQWEARRK